MHARFVRLKWENDARTIGSFYFKPDKPYYFTPGQYTDLTIRHSADDRGMTRTMTITSLPSDPLICITTRFFKGRQSSYKQALLNLDAGDEVMITDAMGDVVLPLDASVPLVFVAGGVGIASYVSMLKWLAAQGDKRRISLLYSVRSMSDIVFSDVLERYKSISPLTTVLYTPSVNTPYAWPGTVKNGRLRVEDIAGYGSEATQFYLSGSQQMVEQFRSGLQDNYGIPQYRLVFDYFDGYVEV